MVRVTRLNNVQQVINCDLIEFIDTTPDTTITMTTGRKVIVRETVDELVNSIVAYKKRIFNGIQENNL